MVFGIFSRKPAPAAAPVISSNAVQPVTDQLQHQEHQQHQQHRHRVQQLRTPSPSIGSGGSIGNPTNSPILTTVRPSRLTSLPADGPSITPSPPPTTDPTALRSLLLTIPPKILSDYVLTQLNPPSLPTTDSETPPAPTLSPLTLTVLTSFFSGITPPPLLHCARCHKGFFDVENDDRSCMVGHDDESAEVERVGRGAGYETLWGCCGKTVEGDGDMGPPDGWCYEGKHTTDTKRARFRADSTIYDDKLVSCHKLRCHGLPPPQSRASGSVIGSSASTRGGSTRKRPRKSMREESNESEHSEGEADAEMGKPSTVARKMKGRSASVSARGKNVSGAVPKGKGKARAANTDDEDIEMNEAAEGAAEPTSTSAVSTKTKPKPKPKPSAKPKSTARATTPKKSSGTTGAMGTAAITRATSATPRSKPTRKSALAKKLSEAEVADSEAEVTAEEDKPRKKRRVT